MERASRSQDAPVRACLLGDTSVVSRCAARTTGVLLRDALARRLSRFVRRRCDLEAVKLDTGRVVRDGEVVPPIVRKGSAAEQLEGPDLIALKREAHPSPEMEEDVRRWMH